MKLGLCFTDPMTGDLGTVVGVPKLEGAPQQSPFEGPGAGL